MEYRTETGRSVLSRLAGFVAAIAVAAASMWALTPPQQADAADLRAFDPGLIITDEIFYSSGAMTATQIQSFLESSRFSCSSYTKDGVRYTCLKEYRADYGAREANANCSAVSSGKDKRASDIIATVARACGINPQVLLVLLQKEQGLVSNAKSAAVYRIATGYACPDTAPCDTKYYGFFNQVYSAAWQFKQYQAKPTSWNYQAGRTNTIKYHPNSKCGTTQVYIRNQATAGLYIYTPYVPNQAALNAGYGTGDTCSSYGNRNFFNYFSDWFGNPANLLKNASFSDKTSSWKSGSEGSVTITSKTNASLAHSGSRYVTVTTPKAGRHIQQSLTRKLKVGQIYEAEIWVRAEADTGTVEGDLHVWTGGGKTETVSVPFAAGQTWTRVVAYLPIEQSGHTHIRFGVRLKTPGAAYRFDSAALFVAATEEPRSPLKVEETAVESGTNGGWVRQSKSATTVKKAYVRGPVSGKYYLKMRTSSAGSHVYQRIPRVTEVGESYTAGAWVRAGNPGETYTGRLRLLGMGGSSESVDTAFTVGGDEWTFVPVTLDIRNPSHQSLRIYVMLDTPGQDLLFDFPQLAPNLYVRDASFERGTSGLNALPSGTTVEVLPTADFAGRGLSGGAADGANALLVSPGSGGYIRLDRSRSLGPGGTYTVWVWVRSGVEGTPATGTLTLSGIQHGSELSESSSATFEATDEWQRVSVAHTVTTAGLDRLRFTVSFDSATPVLVDGVTMR